MARGGWFGRRPRAGDGMEGVPEGIATKCAGCSQILFARDLERNLEVCHRCGHHHRLGARERLAITVDRDSFTEMDAGLRSVDPLSFPDYREKQARAEANTGLHEAMLTGTATIEGRPLVIGVADFGYMGGSMGSVVGEKVTRAMERAIAEGLPTVLFSASGGARVLEGLFALMQMAKTSAASGRLHRARLPFVSVLTDPTTGGVFASYASLGDIVLAEPGAVVGFAGRRVGNQDLGTQLPDDFQTSEFQFAHGMVDRIVARKEMRPTLAYLLAYFAPERHDGG
jgi:acetyl-CoA carboxylase carboxyl transferase subunit beta